MEWKSRYLFILIVIGGGLFLFRLGGRDLWEPDETRYALVAREMRQGGDWIVPHLDGALYSEKPPLFFWMVNFSSLLLGENSEFANRLPSALAGLMALLLTFYVGSRLFDPVSGYLSGLVLSTCLFFPQISRWMMLDSLFCLLFSFALYGFYLGMNRPKKQRFHFLLAGIWMALATLTKGPIGLLPIPLFLIYAAATREFRGFWNRNLLYGILLSIGLVMAWILPAVHIAGRSYGTPNILHQTIGRFAAGWSHPKPFYFYLATFPIGFFPWVVFLPMAVADGFSGRETRRKEFLLAFVWFAFIFLFFSLSKGKKENYLLPLYPAAAILVGRWLSSCWGNGQEKRRLWIPLGIVTLLFLTAWVVLLIQPRWVPSEIGASFGVWLLLPVSLGGIVSLFVLQRSKRLAVSCMIAGMIVAEVQLLVCLPRMNNNQSIKPFAHRILSRMAPDDQLKIWKFQSTGLLYYTEKPVEQVKTINRFLEVFNASNRIFMVIEREDLTQLRKKVDVPIYPVEKTNVAQRELFLVSNHPVHRVQ